MELLRANRFTKTKKNEKYYFDQYPVLVYIE